jgi:hypothetical protein
MTCAVNIRCLTGGNRVKSDRFLGVDKEGWLRRDRRHLTSELDFVFFLQKR